MLNSFRTSNGTLSDRGIVRTRRMKITAKDLREQGYPRTGEVPFPWPVAALGRASQSCDGDTACQLECRNAGAQLWERQFDRQAICQQLQPRVFLRLIMKR